MSSTIDVLKKTCARHGMATDGTRSELSARLLIAPRTKKAVKEDDPPKKTDVAEDDGFVAYKISERASVTEYITKEDDIQEEIMRRWTVLKSNNPVAKKAPEPNPKVKVLQADAEDQVAAAAHARTTAALARATAAAHARATALRQQATVAQLGIAAAQTNSIQAVHQLKETHQQKATYHMQKALEEQKTAEALDQHEGGMVSESQVAGDAIKSDTGKRKKEEEQPTKVVASEEDEPDMEWASKISEARLLKKVKKEHMIPLLEDFGLPSKGSKRQLAWALAEQLHYDTDDGAE